MSNDFNHIVIGAGISGLGAAHLSARRGLSTLVLESGHRVGGCINSLGFEDLGGFWIEAGGHTCFNSYGNLLGILDDLALTHRAQAKAKVGYKLWKGKERRPIATSLHLWEAALSLPRIAVAKKTGRSVSEYYGAILGKRNYRDLLRHAFQAVVCQPADDYPAEALFRRKPRRKGMLKAFTFPQGLSEIPRAIAEQERLEVRTGQAVTAIEPDSGGFRVTAAGAGELSCDYLTLAVPPDAAARLIPPEFADAQAVAASIGMSEIETLALAFRRNDLSLPALAGLIAVDDAFYSAVSRDFMADPGYRGFAFHFRPGTLDATAQLARACEALSVAPERVAAQRRVHNRLPALRAGHGERVARLDGSIAGSRLAITGNWFVGVSIEDALTRSRAESDRLFGPLPAAPK